MHQRYRRDDRRVHRVVRHLDRLGHQVRRGHHVRDRDHLQHRLGAVVASHLGLGAQASWLVLGVGRVRNRRLLDVHLALRHRVRQDVGRHRSVGRQHLGLGVGRRQDEVRHLGVDLGVGRHLDVGCGALPHPWRTGCSLREGHVDLALDQASGLASLRHLGGQLASGYLPKRSCPACPALEQTDVGLASPLRLALACLPSVPPSVRPPQELGLALHLGLGLGVGLAWQRQPLALPVPSGAGVGQDVGLALRQEQPTSGMVQGLRWQKVRHLRRTTPSSS